MIGYAVLSSSGRLIGDRLLIDYRIDCIVSRICISIVRSQVSRLPLDHCIVCLMAETRDCSDSDLTSLSMFDGSDFESWRDQMLLELRQRGLHGPLDGITGRPCGMSDN